MENKPKVEILSTVGNLKSLDGVVDIKARLVNKVDVDIVIEVADEVYKIPTLIHLERQIYSELYHIKNVKTINDGLSILDNHNHTYKIKIVSV